MCYLLLQRPARRDAALLPVRPLLLPDTQRPWWTEDCGDRSERGTGLASSCRDTVGVSDIMRATMQSERREDLLFDQAPPGGILMTDISDFFCGELRLFEDLLH